MSEIRTSVDEVHYVNYAGTANLLNELVPIMLVERKRGYKAHKRTARRKMIASVSFSDTRRELGEAPRMDVGRFRCTTVNVRQDGTLGATHRNDSLWDFDFENDGEKRLDQLKIELFSAVLKAYEETSVELARNRAEVAP